MERNILKEGLSREAEQAIYGDSVRHMFWSCQYEPRCGFYLYMPKCPEEKICQAIVYVHGTGRRYAEEACRELFEIAEAEGCCVLMPLFPGGVTDLFELDGYKLLWDEKFHYDEILIHMVEEAHMRYPQIDTSGIWLFGHSGGGQFCNRFFYQHPEFLYGVSISAPGRPTFLDDTRDFYWGIRNWKQIFGKEIELEKLRKIPVQVMVGERDKAFIGDAFCGDNRWERIHYLYEDLVFHGIQVTFTPVKGVGHVDGEEERVRLFGKWFRTR